MKYYFKPDIYVTLISILCVGLVGYLWSTVGSPASITFILSILLTLVFAWYLSRMPVYTYVDSEKIIVKQLVGAKTFIRKDVTLRRLTSNDVNSTYRTFGSGGLGGYIGNFRISNIGDVYMLAINKEQLTLISTLEGKQFVINFPEGA